MLPTTATMALVFTGNNVVLPNSDGLQPATIVVENGLIKEIIPGYLTKSDLPRHQAATWVDAGDKYILPGLVERVDSVYHLGCYILNLS